MAVFFFIYPRRLSAAHRRRSFPADNALRRRIKVAQVGTDDAACLTYARVRRARARAGSTARYQYHASSLLQSPKEQHA